MCCHVLVWQFPIENSTFYQFSFEHLSNENFIRTTWILESCIIINVEYIAWISGYEKFIWRIRYRVFVASKEGDKNSKVLEYGSNNKSHFHDIFIIPYQCHSTNFCFWRLTNWKMRCIWRAIISNNKVTNTIHFRCQCSMSCFFSLKIQKRFLENGGIRKQNQSTDASNELLSLE